MEGEQRNTDIQNIMTFILTVKQRLSKLTSEIQIVFYGIRAAFVAMQCVGKHSPSIQTLTNKRKSIPKQRTSKDAFWRIEDDVFCGVREKWLWEVFDRTVAVEAE
jgi:hypothetical protein